MSGPAYTVQTGQHGHIVAFDPAGVITLDGVPVDADIRCIDGSSYSIVVRGISYRFRVHASDGRYEVNVDGVPVTVTVDNERTRLLRQYTTAAAQRSAVALVAAPMPALVVRVGVSAGDAVTQGQGLVVLEAMKMENEIRAPRSAVVKQVHVSAGKAVEKGEPLVTLE